MDVSVRFWEPGKEFQRIEQEVMATMRDVLSKGDLIMREQMVDFERNLAAFVGTADAVGVSNCTDGMRLLLEAAGIGPGDEVITVSHTFMATMAVVHQVGATPVLVDVGDDHVMNVDLVEKAITRRTKAIMPVHLNGRLVVMDRLMEIAHKHDLLVIEDSAQALGGAYLGVRGGAWGLAGAFSFYPAKLLGAYGDAGAIVTSDTQLANRVRELRDHGRISKTGYSGWGWNCRLDNLQAAVLDLKLKKVPDWINQRRRLAAIYDEELADVGRIKRPAGPDGGPHFDIYQNYVIEADRRDELVAHLAARGIETLVSPGPIPNHKQPVGLDHFHLPKTEDLCTRVLSLPLNNELDEEQVLEVAAGIKGFYS
ncbi:MAG: DegT/DnrJ/EryC1/StrS family aminotransferase [Chloroflexi bacterium]|nr:MAG: DegT/DnrJ/EryC1/StrS family aminotransferase [Chloroflexota bacterium]TMG00491.1 MAG: DegT/DnrJ/EryC1/StrS family aminotransferase [Chloroflexota bacterium]